MTPSVSYTRPLRVDETVAQLDGRAAILAGGTDLVTMLRGGLAAPELIVDVKHIPELREVSRADGWSLGAAVTMERIASIQDVSLAAVVDGARILGAPQTRTRATIGGNVCRASPAGDTLAGLLVLGAEIELASTRGRRVVPVSEFFASPGVTIIAEDELATRLIVPVRRGTSAYERQTYRRWLDLAVVGVAIRIDVDDSGTCVDADIAVVALAPTPIAIPSAAARLVGTRLDDASVEEASAAIRAFVDPIDDVRGTRAYRLHVIPSLVRRALGRALGRAGGAL